MPELCLCHTVWHKQYHSLRCVVICVNYVYACLYGCTCAHTQIGKTTNPSLISTTTSTLSQHLYYWHQCFWLNMWRRTEPLTSELLQSKEEKEFGPETCLVSCVGMLINQPWCQHCIATTSGQAKLSIGEPRTGTTGPFMAVAGMGSDLEWGKGMLAPQYCFEPARLM